MPTNKGIDKTLYSNAVLASRLKIDIKPLVIPQPKQDTPKMALTGHKDTEKAFVATNKIAKKQTLHPKNVRYVFFCHSYF